MKLFFTVSESSFDPLKLKKIFITFTQNDDSSNRLDKYLLGLRLKKLKIFHSITNSQ